MTEPLVARSRAVIVHSRWADRKLRPVGTPVFASHLAGSDDVGIRQDARHESRRRLGFDERNFYIGVFGFINSHKRIGTCIGSVAALREEGIPAVLLLVGPINDSRVDLGELRSRHGVDSAAVIHTGHVTDEMFRLHLAAVDVAVNLRYPSMGESSASLMNALAHAIPALVTDRDQFAELPDSVAWKVDVGDNEVAVLVAYLRHLLETPATREALGRNGQTFVRRFASFDNAAADYVRVCRAC